jgi:putative transposase
VEWVKRSLGWVLEIVKRPEDQKGFVVLPRRWVVERTLGWLGR